MFAVSRSALSLASRVSIRRRYVVDGISSPEKNESNLRLLRFVILVRFCRSTLAHLQHRLPFHSFAAVQTADKHTLVLVRHGESTWNLENKVCKMCHSHSQAPAIMIYLLMAERYPSPQCSDKSA